MLFRAIFLVVASAAAVGAALISMFSAPSAHATAKWVATANSPSHEQIEFAWGMDQADAESRVMAQCAQNERADDYQLLASGPDCVGIAWDGDQPINHVHAVSGGGRDVVIQGATAAAGPHANGAEARCSWDG
jgi:hypothetical protein